MYNTLDITTTEKIPENYIDEEIVNEFEDGITEIDVTVDDLCYTADKKIDWGKLFHFNCLSKLVDLLLFII